MVFSSLLFTFRYHAASSKPEINTEKLNQNVKNKKGILEQGTHSNYKPWDCLGV